MKYEDTLKALLENALRKEKLAEGKIDDLKDRKELEKSTKSAYDDDDSDKPAKKSAVRKVTGKSYGAGDQNSDDKVDESKHSIVKEDLDVDDIRIFARQLAAGYISLDDFENKIAELRHSGPTEIPDAGADIDTDIDLSAPADVATPGEVDFELEEPDPLAANFEPKLGENKSSARSIRAKLAALGESINRLAEAAKPSAGLSAKKKSNIVKKAKAGKDLGKPGKNFDKVAKAAGGGEKGKKIAAAAMWSSEAKKESKKSKATESVNTKETTLAESSDLTAVLKLAGIKPLNG